MQWLLILIFITGCSGYRYTQQDNPLSQYGIQSLSVPMFYNYSNQPEVSNNFTRETYRLLSSYHGLKLRSGYHQESDAVMIGIIKSPIEIPSTDVVDTSILKKTAITSTPLPSGIRVWPCIQIFRVGKTNNLPEQANLL